MRIGERGSLSPAGDLMAFGLTVVIVVSLYSLMVGSISDEGKGSELDPSVLGAIQDWSALDRDGDGVLEAQSVLDMRSGTSADPFPMEGTYLVTINWSGSDHRIIVHDRNVRTDIEALSAGPSHSVMVRVDSGHSIEVGRISVMNGRII